MWISIPHIGEFPAPAAGQGKAGVAPQETPGVGALGVLAFWDNQLRKIPALAVGVESGFVLSGDYRRVQRLRPSPIRRAGLTLLGGDCASPPIGKALADGS